MKKRILSCLMALALCLTLLPTAALAADSDGMNHNPHTGTELKMDGDTLKKGTGEWDVSDVKLWKPSDTPVSAYVLDGGTYYLGSDLNFTGNKTTTTECAIVITGNVTLCLNGHSITCTDRQGVICVYAVDCGSLTLTDCKGTGEIKGGTNWGVDVRSGKTFNMYGGTITGNGGVYLNGSTGVTATFNMYGGKIDHNTGIGVKLDGTSGATTTFKMSGGTISNNKGGVSTVGDTFTMSGGEITSNTTNGNGGGVNIGNGGKFTMNAGAKITQNTADYAGGGVYVSGGTFIMNGGEIKSNTAETNGGGVYVTKVASSSNSAFTMNGGEIKSNTANTAGGGVFVYNGTFTVSGKPTVNNNTSGSKVTDNVYLDANKTITIDSGLTDGTDIGVTTGSAKVPTENSTVAIATATGYANGYLSYFKSDNDSYEIVPNSQNTQLELKAKPRTSLDSTKTTIEITNKDALVYSGSKLTPTVKVTCNGTELQKDKDYTVSGDSGTDAKDYTLKITGTGKYTGSVEQEWTIQQHAIGAPVPGSTLTVTKTYDGTNALPTAGLTENSVTFESEAKIDSISGMTLKQGEDFTISGSYVGDNVNVGTHSAKITITLENTNYTFDNGASADIVADGIITKAPAPRETIPHNLNVVNNKADTYTLNLSELLPEAPKGSLGKIEGYTLGTVNLGNYYEENAATVDKNTGKLTLPIKAANSANIGDQIGTVTVKVTTQNYEDITLTINVKAVAAAPKDPEYTPPKAKTLTYNGQAQALITGGTVKEGGTMLYRLGATGEYSENIPTATNAGEYTVYYKVKGSGGYNDTAEQSIPVHINKAKPTGEPIYTKITAANKTLEDAKLAGSTGWPTGTIKWVDKETGTELSNSTVVVANKEYKWVFIPNDTDNYETAVGTVVLYTKSAPVTPPGGGSSGGGSSSGGGGGGSSSSVTTVKTNTVTNPDGSVTKIETKSDGTVVATTTGKDGGVSKTETKKDGSSVTENKAADGSTGTVKTDKNGQTEAKTALSNKAIENAKKNGEAVKAPVEVEAARNSGAAPTVKVELPKNAGETEVEIPVSNAKPGTVAVLVHPDGTEEILKDSIPTENGIRLTVDGSATVKIVDNSKDFIDTQNHWAKDEIDFVSARELVNGISATRYAPNATATRAQLWTILARQNDTDLSGGANWYEKAQLWSKDKGISDGTQPDAAINRAQMVTMLWRTMGQPAAGGAANFNDVPANSYYAQAVAWAVENGITTGIGGGRFDPNSTCTRAQIATFLARSMK